MRGVVGTALALGGCAALLGTAVVASALSVLGVGSGTPSASSAATSAIPPAILALYQQAAATCPGLPWTVLAAVGTVESDNGQSDLSGRAQRCKRSRGRRTDAIRTGRPSRPTTSRSRPADRIHRVPTTRPTPSTPPRRLLCANGASGGADIAGAIYAYNHSAPMCAGARAGAVLRPGRRPTRSPGPRSPTPAPSRCNGLWPRSARPTSGVVRRLVSGSTARAWCRRPTRWRRMTPAPRRPGPIRRHAQAAARRRRSSPVISSSSETAPAHRPRRPVRRCRRRCRRHGRRAVHRGRRAGRGVPGRPSVPDSAASSSSARRGPRSGSRDERAASPVATLVHDGAAVRAHPVGPDRPGRLPRRSHSSQAAHSRGDPRRPCRPSGVRTQARSCHGGRCRTCWRCPHSSSATQSPTSSSSKPTMAAPH